MRRAALAEPGPRHDDPFTQVVYAEETLWAVLSMLDNMFFAGEGERSELIHRAKSAVWDALTSVMNAKELLKGR